MNNIVVKTNIENYKNDFMEMVRAFNPYNNEGAEDALTFDVNIEKDDKNIDIIINSGLFNNKYDEDRLYSSNTNKFGNHYELVKKDGTYYRIYTHRQEINSEIKSNSLAKRWVKLMLYEDLSELFNKDLPYGSLTGIRPTKLYRETNNDKDYFSNKLHVSDEKLELIDSIVNLQKNYYVKDDSIVDVFINIPFCTTRCSYCSFISAEIGKVIKFIPEYIDSIIREIDGVHDIVKDNGYSVRAVYIGGGTPTSIDDEFFERILSKCDFGQAEFTVEAGRPDSITSNKLDIMKKYGVTRISINPQSFNQKTLGLIGRNHTIDDIYRVYNEALKYDFSINMDLIAMLPGETFEDFQYSVDEAIKLNPNNITVHTLALKKGSKLRENNYEQNMSKLAESMIDYSENALLNAGYKPYYMYRQKYMSGNLENTGYTRDDDVCLYNIDIMEESLSIIASGAGGISKRNFALENRLERLANAKGLQVYLDRIDDIINNKYKFFEISSEK